MAQKVINDELHEVVVVVNPDGTPITSSPSLERELVVSTYRCKAAFTGASVGDTITATQVLDVSGTPSTVSTVWRNQTTAVDLAGAPSAANLELTGATALTDAQLRASLVPVDTLATPGAPRVQATSAASVGIVLTATCRRVSMYATQGTWYSITGSATAASHYIGAGERLDFDVPASTTINVLQETTAGSIRVTELA